MFQPNAHHSKYEMVGTNGLHVSSRGTPSNMIIHMSLDSYIYPYKTISISLKIGADWFQIIF